MTKEILYIVSALCTIVSFFFFLRTGQIPLPSWLLRVFVRLRPVAPPASDFLPYLRSFLDTNRCPSIDDEMCSPQRIQKTLIHYRLAKKADPPAYVGALDSLGAEMQANHIETLPSFVDRLTAWREGILTTRKNLFVLLGDPGFGKSSLAVQLVAYIAERSIKNSSFPVPVYVNLAHFDKDYAPNLAGLCELVTQAIGQAGPRYAQPSGTVPKLLGARLTRQVISGGSNGNIFFVLDGMDEMPPESDRIEAIAAFMDDAQRRRCTFLVTCRYFDYVKLSGLTRTLQLQRLDLLPWTTRMVQNYLEYLSPSSEIPQKVALQQIDSFTGAHAGSRNLYHPLVVSLVVHSDHVPADGRLSDLWDDFLAQKLQPHLRLLDLPLPQAISALARFAYDQVWPPARPFSLDRNLAGAGCRAGVLRKTSSGLMFEIRPLMHHFAAKELVARIKEKGKLPTRVKLEDINLREVLKIVSEQFGTDSQWLQLVGDNLAFHEASIRVHGDRLVFVASCLTREQIESSPDLKAIVARLVETLIAHGDGVERERCLDALVRKPFLFDQNVPQAPLFFAWITESGSPGALNWLIRLLAHDHSLRARYQRIWIRALAKALDEGSLGRQLQRIAVSRVERIMGNRLKRPLNLLLTGIRLILMFLGHYAMYVAGWSLALALAAPVYRLAPTGPQLHFQQVWKMQFDFRSISFQLNRLYMMALTLYLPRYYLQQQAAQGIGFRKWWKRFLTVLLIIFLGRFGFFLLDFLRANFQLLRQALLFVGLAYFAFFTVRALFFIVRNPPKMWRSILRNIFNLRVSYSDFVRSPIRAQSDSRSKGGSPIVVNPSDIMTVLLQDAVRELDVHVPAPSRAILARVATLSVGGMWLAAVSVVFVFRGPAAATIVMVLGLAVAWFVASVIDPIIRARTMKHRIQAAIRKGLLQNVQATVIEVLREIEDKTQPDWVRSLYVDALDGIRFDVATLDILERFYVAFPASPIKEKLTEVVLRALHEVNKTKRAAYR